MLSGFHLPSTATRHGNGLPPDRGMYRVTDTSGSRSSGSGPPPARGGRGGEGGKEGRLRRKGAPPPQLSGSQRPVATHRLYPVVEGPALHVREAGPRPGEGQVVLAVEGVSGPSPLGSHLETLARLPGRPDPPRSRRGTRPRHSGQRRGGLLPDTPKRTGLRSRTATSASPSPAPGGGRWHGCIRRSPWTGGRPLKRGGL